MIIYYDDIINCTSDYILDNNLISECFHRAKNNDFKFLDSLVIKYSDTIRYKPILLFMKSFYNFYNYRSIVYTNFLANLENTEKKVIINQSVYDFITTINKELAENYLTNVIYIEKRIPIEFLKNLILIPISVIKDK